MSTNLNSDRQFHENLRALGQANSVPAGPDEALLARSAAVLDGTGAARQCRTGPFRRRPALFSTLGLAASIALVAGLFIPWQSGKSARAATILAKLDEQIRQTSMIEVYLESVTVEEVSVDGFLQVTNGGVAGDLAAIVDEGEGGDYFEADLSLGLSNESGWVLVRNLVIADPEVQPFVALLFPPGGETLVMLPPEAIAGKFGIGLDKALDELQSGELTEVITHLIQSHDEVGATVEDQPDGSILLTLPIEDADSLTAIARVFKRMEMGDAADEEVGGVDADVEVDAPELYGTTFEVVYNPVSQTVQSFSMRNFGETQGTISVSIGQGEIDKSLLDVNRVKTANTRVLDLSAFQAILSDLQID